MAVLSKTDLDNINKSLAMLEEVKKEITRAELAKIDVTEQKTRVAELETKLRAIKQAYFPGK